jgi:ATP-dependent RNA helicase RhlE
MTTQPNEIAVLKPVPFADFAIDPSLQAAIASAGLTTPTEVQSQTLPLTLKGDDLIAVAPTGTGKTLVYALTIWQRLLTDPTSRALVLAPSRETAVQIFKVFESLWSQFPVTKLLVLAGAPDRKQVTELNKLPRLLVATPGRLLDQLSHNKLLLQKVAVMVIDEADRMLDAGFGPQLKRIRSTMRGDFQTLLFAATLTPQNESAAQAFVRPTRKVVRVDGAEKPVEGLRQILVHLEPGQKKECLLEVLRDAKGTTVVFVADQPSCESVQEHLKAMSFSSNVIHGAHHASHRDRVLTDFRDGKFRTLVTTDLLARGLDVPGLSLVVNFDLPSEPEDFLHRIGRTARAGATGTAITFVTAADEPKMRLLKRYLAGAEENSF